MSNRFVERRLAAENARILREEAARESAEREKREQEEIKANLEQGARDKAAKEKAAQEAKLKKEQEEARVKAKHDQDSIDKVDSEKKEENRVDNVQQDNLEIQEVLQGILNYEIIERSHEVSFTSVKLEEIAVELDLIEKDQKAQDEEAVRVKENLNQDVREKDRAKEDVIISLEKKAKEQTKKSVREKSEQEISGIGSVTKFEIQQIKEQDSIIKQENTQSGLIEESFLEVNRLSNSLILMANNTRNIFEDNSGENHPNELLYVFHSNYTLNNDTTTCYEVQLDKFAESISTTSVAVNRDTYDYVIHNQDKIHKTRSDSFYIPTKKYDITLLANDYDGNNIKLRTENIDSIDSNINLINQNKGQFELALNKCKNDILKFSSHMRRPEAKKIVTHQKDQIFNDKAKLNVDTKLYKITDSLFNNAPHIKEFFHSVYFKELLSKAKIPNLLTAFNHKPSYHKILLASHPDKDRTIPREHQHKVNYISNARDFIFEKTTQKKISELNYDKEKDNIIEQHIDKYIKEVQDKLTPLQDTERRIKTKLEELENQSSQEQEKKDKEILQKSQLQKEFGESLTPQTYLHPLVSIINKGEDLLLNMKLLSEFAKLTYQPTTDNLWPTTINVLYYLNRVYESDYYFVIPVIDVLGDSYKGKFYYDKIISKAIIPLSINAVKSFSLSMNIPYKYSIYSLALISIGINNIIQNTLSLYDFFINFNTLEFKLQSDIAWKDFYHLIGMNSHELILTKILTKQILEKEHGEEYAQKLFHYIYEPNIDKIHTSNEKDHSLDNKNITLNFPTQSEFLKYDACREVTEFYNHILQTNETVHQDSEYYCYDIERKILDHVVLEVNGDTKYHKIVEHL
jgi:hypothetical protein